MSDKFHEGEVISDGEELEMIASRLSFKQHRFCESYLGDARGNATEAARLAGYNGSQHDLECVGGQLMQHPSIRRYLHERVRKHMKADEVLAILADHTRGSMEDFLEVNMKTGAVCIDLRKAARRGQLHLVKKLKNGKDGLEIELYDAQNAAQLICRNLGLFNDQMRLAVKIDQVIDALPEDIRDDVRFQLAEIAASNQGED